MTDSDAPIIFKKRVTKVSNSRKRDFQVKEEDGQDHFDSNTLSDIKLQQTIRQRKTGLSTDALSKSNKSMSTSEADDNGIKTIGSVMGRQYTTEIDYGIQANIPHKKLMDQYIDEQLGLNKSDGAVTKKQETAEDMLYRIPDQLKVLGEHKKTISNTSSDPSDNGIVPAWSTQLAEVALPISFKMRNIEATERAAAKDAARSQPKASIATARYRFNKYEAPPKLHPSIGEHLELIDPTADTAVSQDGTQQLQQADSGANRHKRSADDHALEQYKKRQMNYRR